MSADSEEKENLFESREEPGSPLSRAVSSNPSTHQPHHVQSIARTIAAICAIVIALCIVIAPSAGIRLTEDASDKDENAAISEETPTEATDNENPVNAVNITAPQKLVPSTINSLIAYTSTDPEAAAMKERIELGDDPASYEPGYALIDLPDGSTADQVVSDLSQIQALADVTIADIEGGFAKIALPASLSVSEATNLINESGHETRAQPNYRYYIQKNNVDAATITASTASTNPPLTMTKSDALISGTPLGDALGVQSAPNDEYYAKQWYLSSINAPLAWKTLPTSSRSTTVAVIDSAFLTTHEDLKSNIAATYDAVKKTSAISTEPDGADIDHGTHCAGIVAATANNSKGISGVTFNKCKVLPVRVADSEGKIYSNYIASAYSYLVAHQRSYNIRVASMSLGAYVASKVTRATDPVIYDAISKARDAGIVSVVPACNDDEEVPYRAFPSDFDNVISVIALRKASNGDGVARAGFSNYNVKSQKDKDISAPGNSIMSLFGDHTSSYNDLSGTSMATPIVAGSLGLVFTASPNLSADEATSKLYSTARDLTKGHGTSSGWDRVTGYGEVNLAAAVSPSQAYLSGKSEVLAGETTTLKVKIDGVKQSASTWKWKTSDEKTAAVSSSGKLTGKNGGQVIVTATKGKLVAQQTVTVQVPASTFEVSLNSKKYKGKALKPEPTVVCNGKKLTQGRDYTVSYSRNVNAGKGRVTIMGIAPYYVGTMKKSFKIEKAKMSKASIKLQSTKLSYNGKAQVPIVIVRDIGVNKETILKKGRDFKLSGGVVSGSGKVKITAKKACKNFTGSVKKSFKVKVAKVAVYRLHNPRTGGYRFTSSKSERRDLKRRGWKSEGVAWKAPKTVGKKVYQLYDRKTKSHYYTASAKKRKRLVERHGWENQGVCWRSFASTGKPIYRLYNPRLSRDQYVYTTNSRWRDVLATHQGWVYKGVTWYAV